MQNSSSRRETRSENRHPTKKTTGCMSGIFHLLSRHHHNRSRKRLTSAGKKDKVAVSPSKSGPLQDKKPPPTERGEERKNPNRAEASGRHSCDAPRSPTLPPEIRRPGPAASPDSPRRPSAVVARLMGLDEVPVSSPESSAEKRRKLLGALEKCDEDLRALKRIIQAAQLPEIVRRSQPAEAVGSARKELDCLDSRMAAMKCLEFNGEQPSPVSVLETLYSPRSRSKRSDNANINAESNTTVRSTTVERQLVGAFDSGEHHKKAKDTNQSTLFFRRISIERLPRMACHREDEVMEYFGLAEKGRREGDRRGWRMRSRRSRAMVESVVEVWRDGVWEERWEFGRVGVGLEGEIFGDLVEEVVMEMLSCYHKLSFPLGTSRKRLYF